MSKPPITKRRHFLEKSDYRRTACGKDWAANNLSTTFLPDSVTCQSCLADLGKIPDNRKGPIGERSDFKVATYTDFGDLGRVYEVARHYTIASAMRQYARLWELYGRRGEARVWQKMISPEK